MLQTPLNHRALLNTKEAAKILGVSHQFLSLDRHQAKKAGIAPKIPFIAVSERIIRYDERDLIEYIEARKQMGRRS